MFELNPNIMEQITTGLIFDNKSFTAEEQSKIEDLLSLRHNGLYATSNTTRNSEYLIARPDVTLTAALTQEILTKRVQIKYVGTNLIANLGDYFETPEEIIKNYNNEQINRLLERVINFRYHSDRVANSQNGKNAIVFANCIRGQSYLNKLKKIDLTKATTDRYKIERIKELELLEGRMDNTIVLKIVDVECLTVIYYVITNKHSWKKVRKMSGKIIPLFPESVVEGVNKEFKDKIEFLGEIWTQMPKTKKKALLSLQIS